MEIMCHKHPEKPGQKTQHMLQQRKSTKALNDTVVQRRSDQPVSNVSFPLVRQVSYHILR